MLMPTARYSSRAISANSRTVALSRSAAMPSVSGHCEKGPAVKEAPTLSTNACRGSVEMVTGMPCGVCAARRCNELFHRAASRALLMRCTLK